MQQVRNAPAPHLPWLKSIVMADSEKPTINVRNQEVDLLDTIRRLAPQFNVPRQQAEIYGVWTICYHRFCSNQDLPVVWMDSVSAFMDFLGSQAQLSDAERNQALDAVMFYLTDIRHAEDQDEIDAVESFPRPTSARSLFAHLLLRCPIEMKQALRIRANDVDMESGTIRIQAGDRVRTVQLLPSLRTGMRMHLKRIRAETEENNPLLFGLDAPTTSMEVLDEPSPSSNDVEDATEAATRVMKTLLNTAGTPSKRSKQEQDDLEEAPDEEASDEEATHGRGTASSSSNSTPCPPDTPDSAR